MARRAGADWTHRHDATPINDYLLAQEGLIRETVDERAAMHHKGVTTCRQHCRIREVCIRGGRPRGSRATGNRGNSQQCDPTGNRFPISKMTT